MINLLDFEVSDFMPIVTALAALLGVVITNFAHERRSKTEFENNILLRNKELKREKLEEMHLLFQKWEIDVQGLCLVFIPVYKGAYLAEKAMEISKENRLQEKGDYQRLQTLLQLYFTELEEDFKLMLKHRDKVLDFCRQNRSFKRDKLKGFNDEQESFVERADTFKLAMAQQIAKL